MNLFNLYAVELIQIVETFEKTRNDLILMKSINEILFD